MPDDVPLDLQETNLNGYVHHFQDDDNVSFNEFGSERSEFFDDYNPDARPPMWFRTVDKMRRGDAQVRSTMRIVKAPMLSAQWYVEPATSDPQDELIAEFIRWALFKGQSRNWQSTLWSALLALDYGVSILEKVFYRTTWKSDAPGAKPRNVVAWKKFAPRHPSTIEEFLLDDNGGVRAVEHTKISGDISFSVETVRIPTKKILRFTFDDEGSPWGFSLLRSAYKHWYYKDNLYKVDAIQKERHGIGVPEIQLPPGFTEQDKKFARQLGKNLRSNESAYAVKPPGWEIGFIDLPTQPVAVMSSAEHHDLMLARNVLAQFLNLGTSEVGSRSMAAPMQDLFLKAQRYIADMVSEVFNRYAIPELVNLNFNTTRYPRIKVRRIGEANDQRAFASTVNSLVEAGMLTPDDETEKWVREMIEFPQSKAERSVEERMTDRRLNIATKVGEPEEREDV